MIFSLNIPVAQGALRTLGAIKSAESSGTLQPHGAMLRTLVSGNAQTSQSPALLPSTAHVAYGPFGRLSRVDGGSQVSRLAVGSAGSACSHALIPPAYAR